MNISKKPQQKNPQSETILHLRLTNRDWLNCFSQLTRSELGVLFYIRTLNPFGDRQLDIRSEQLGQTLTLHRSTISKALKSLEQKDFISMEITSARVAPKIINLKPTLCLTEQSLCVEEQSLCVEKQSLCVEEQSLCVEKQSLCVEEHHDPVKVNQSMDLKNPQTNTNSIQTNTNLNQTDPPLPPQRGDTKNSPQQVEIFSSQQPETANETVNQSTPPQPPNLGGEGGQKPTQDSIVFVEETTSAHVEQKINKTKRFNQQQADWLIQQYNQNKPSTWSKCLKCTTSLYRSLSKLYSEFGAELANVWLDALQYPIAVNNWWQSGNNRSIQTLLRRDRVAEWSDAVNARTNGEKVMTEQELSMAQTYAERMTALTSEEFLKELQEEGLC
jgi:hypothetical protein